MKNFRKSLWLLSALLLGGANLKAQMSAPQAENVYGGRINAISVIPEGGGYSRIYIATESANSLFYADVNTALSPLSLSFTALPGADASAGYGAYINNIAAQEGSDVVFFQYEGNLLSTHPGTSTVTSVLNGVLGFALKNDILLHVFGNQFGWGTLDVFGNYTSVDTITSPTAGMVRIVVSEVDGLVYIFEEGSTPKLYVSSDDYSSLTTSTTFTDISPSSLSTTATWGTFGVAPDGKLFIAGTDNASHTIAYSDDKTTWTEFLSGVVGTYGPNIAFSGDSANYSVFFGSAYSDSNGVSGSWQKFGDLGSFETHSNDGVVFVDPSNSDVVYMTTDQGLGASHNNGLDIYEIDEGIEAVQVKDFDMTSDKNTAWLASKSGIRMVTNYQTSPVWTNALFPQNDGSPYYSVAMKPGDPNTVYAGNVRVYKSTDAGTTWNRSFSAEDSPYWFNSNGVYVKAIEVCKYNADVVFAGYAADGTDKGGLFYSMDGGSNWSQLLIEATTNGEDVDVQDIIFNVEGSDTVAYIGVEYDLADPQGLSVYRIVKSGSAWTVSQNFDASNTAVGYQITATINDLYVSETGDTLFACGTDAGVNEPHVYAKIVSGSNLWEAITVNGFPYSTGTEGKAVTMGKDTIYCAVDNEIYYFPAGGASWTLGYTYPEGNEINFLYYDELLVGAGTGLYGQAVDGNTTGIRKDAAANENLKIYPNPITKSSTITYSINSDEFVSLGLVDMMGREVESLVNETKTAGTYQIQINAEKLAKGIYVIKLQAGNISSIQDIIIK